MSCPKQKQKKFLGIFKYQPSCDFKIISIGKFMYGVSNDFLVRYECKYCNRPQERHFVSWDELLREGVDNDYIEEAQHTMVYLDNEYQLQQIKKQKNEKT